MNVLTLLYAPWRQYEKAFANSPIPDIKPKAQQPPNDDEPNDEDNEGSSQSSQHTVTEKDTNYIVSFDDTPEADPRQWSSWQKSKMTMEFVTGCDNVYDKEC